MSMDVREAEIGDVPAICQLLTILFAQEAEFEPDYERQRKGVSEVIENPEFGRFLVLEEAGEIIGTVSLLLVPSTALGGMAAILEDLIIRPDRQGRGLGSVLLGQAIELAHELGCLRITVLTDGDNHKAQALYAKFGMERSRMVPMRLVF